MIRATDIKGSKSYQNYQGERRSHCKRSLILSGSFLLQALTGAFATASSSAVLPVTIKGAQSQGVDERVAEFVLPIGSNINTSGACIYYTVGAIFCAKLENLDPSFMQVASHVHLLYSRRYLLRQTKRSRPHFHAGF